MNLPDSFEAHGIRVPHRATGDVKVTCPRCSYQRKKTSDPCLSVNVEKAMWCCHNCGWTGALRNGIDPRRERYTFRTITKAFPEAPSDGVYTFMEKRGITHAVVDRNRITRDRRTIDGKAETCIAFPYYADGELINVKYRSPGKRFSQETGADKILYKLDDIADMPCAIITEGEIDALSFEVAGLVFAVSVPDGAINENVKNPDGKLKCLDTCWNWLAGLERVYLATDNDGPGIRLRDELAERLGKRRCWLITFPDGCKDANEVLLQHGAERLHRCYEEAQQFPLEGIYDVASLSDNVFALHSVGYPTGATTGINAIDKHQEFFRGQLTITTGIPGHMKSSVVDMRNTRLMRRANWKFAYFTPEHFPLETHLHRLAEQMVGKRLLPEGYGQQMTESELFEALAFLHDHVYYVMPEDDDFSLEQILQSFIYLRERYGIDGAVIDPWNYVEHQLNGESETIYIGKALRRVKQVAREYGIHIDIIAHPTKIGTFADGTWRVPTMYDISGSANWYNVPDNGATVYRVFNPDYSTECIEYHQRKVKYAHQGRVGMERLKVLAHHGFGDYNPIDANPAQRLIDPSAPRYSNKDPF